VDYEILQKIPVMIHARRKEAEKLGKRTLAWLVHDEMLVSFLVTLVWRQRNLRNCRIDHNLFRATIPPLVNMAIPVWVREAIKANPQQQFWQFHFREGETKMGREVRSILPRRLVSLLDEYLTQHRPFLLCGSDPKTLFLNRQGGPLTSSQVIYLVSNLTLRYAQRRVTPHIFRDIFAYHWLKQHPEDYLTLSKMLWHKNVQTTLNKYGSKFDESHGLCRVEEWLDAPWRRTRKRCRGCQKVAWHGGTVKAASGSARESTGKRQPIV
jgi:integrase